MLQATCSCGFEEQVSIGPGMLAVETIPLSCRRCRKIRHASRHVRGPDGEPYNLLEIDEWDPATGCPKCHRPVTPIDDAGGPCPRCGDDLIMTFVGVWD